MRKIFVGALFLLLAIPARAVDSISAELGGGSRSVELWRVGAQWQQRPKWLKHSPWQLYWDLTLGSWNSRTGTVHDFGLTPEFRHPIGSRGAYFDAGIGFHVLSDSPISTDFGFSTRFQFGDHVGVGYDFGPFDLAARLQHLSNGGLPTPHLVLPLLLLRVWSPLRLAARVPSRMPVLVEGIPDGAEGSCLIPAPL